MNTSFIIVARGQVEQNINIIPIPVSLHEQPGEFILDQSVHIDLINIDEKLSDRINWFSQKIATVTGIAFNSTTGIKKIRISINKTPDTNLRTEGYHLKITSQLVELTSNTSAGAYYGLQTLLQLLPANIESSTLQPRIKWSLPTVEITDYPRFSWRGLMLDVSRHFFTKEEVKKFIDEMVKYKYNTLHWHLTDDQGWRIEIKKLPELTQNGAFRVKRTGQWGTFLPALANEKATDGGYYNQDDIKEIIQYAANRYVTILPEVDVPGHSQSLISTFPSLSSTRLPYSVQAGWRENSDNRDDNSLDPSNEEVYEKLDIIFGEIAKLFPNPYIHIGGDEAFKGFWQANPRCKTLMAKKHMKNVEELQSYFIKRLVTILQSKGKKLIGWDEILQGGLAPEATVMSWRGMEGGIQAAKMNHEVIMTPWDYVYLDLYQGDPRVEPNTYGMCRLTDSYHFEPVPIGISEKLILGGQANVWTEQISNFRHLEYMVWPRGIALSEVYWSPKNKKQWPDFFNRLENNFNRLDAAGINYAKSCYDVIFQPSQPNGLDLVVKLTAEAPGLDIYYTFENCNVDDHFTKYTGSPISFPFGATEIRAITYKQGKPIGKQIIVSKEELAERSKEEHHVY